MTELVVRPLTAGDLHLFHELDLPALVGVAAVGRDFDETVRLGQYRAGWTWVAQRSGRVVARAAWWAGPEDDAPIALDWLDFAAGEEDAAVEILRLAGVDAEYCLVLPPGWRENAEVRRAAEARVAVAERAGLRRFVERIRYTWTPADGVPERPRRLRFEPVPDDEDVRAVLARIVHGSLDAHHRRSGVDAAVADEMEFLHWMPSPREWWRVAYTPSGDLVGLTVPGRNYGGPVIGLVGVVPEWRGRGYAYDLLVEATYLLVAEGAEEIGAETDTTNTPMAATFARAGYPISQERVYLK